MALDNFIAHFDTTYQAIFQKLTVSDAVSNKRFESNLTFGQTVTRFTLKDNVRVRDVAAGDDYNDRVIDRLDDGEEMLRINKQKSANFQISRKDRVQNGPLSAAAVQGTRVARKMAIAVDSDVFSQVDEAHTTFDAGDLSGLGSNGTPISLSETNLFSVLTKLRAKLRRNNIGLENTVFVMDSFATAVVEANRLGRQIDSAETTFRNGFAGNVLSSGWFISENLTGQAEISGSANADEGDTIVVEGVTFTFVSAIGTAAGNVLIGSDLNESFDNLATLIADPATTTATGVALSADDQLKITDALQLTATVAGAANAAVVTLTGVGAGRMNIAKTGSILSIDKNFIHAYFGKRSTIDLVLQDKMDMFETQEPRKPVTNYLTEYIYGFKVFEDSAEQFIDVLIDVTVS